MMRRRGGNNVTPRHLDEAHRTAQWVFCADDNNRAELSVALLVSFPFLKIILHVPMYNSRGGASPPLEISTYYNIQVLLWKTDPSKPKNQNQGPTGSACLIRKASSGRHPNLFCAIHPFSPTQTFRKH